MNESQIFANALKSASPAERSDYLDEACAGNPPLREAVDALLEVHANASDFLERPVGSLVGLVDVPPPVTGEYTPDPAGEPAAANHAGKRESVGTVIGPYKLLQQIGEGGMGTVYMAEQTQPVRRKVALKVIKADMDSRQVVARFEAERQALALMDHVNIARIFDGGTTDNGRPYFVMELVHGVPITKYCDDNHLTPRERLELFVPVCQAIQHAHQKGIIHRDIKPSNVMVTLYDGKPVPKVIDFGVAKATEQKLTERTLFTQYGTMVGTLEYMSPEQAEMSALGIDTRSDIYSLGVLLYELLTGSTPLTHKRMKEAAYGEILRMIKEEEPQKPSTRLSDSGEALASISAQRHMEPAKLSKLMRGELDWIVMKTLEKDRNRRYETANGFAADVQRYLNDEPVKACPATAGYRFRKFARRNKGKLAVASLILFFIVLLGGGGGWVMRDRSAREAEAARDRAARQAAVDQEVSLALKEAERWQGQGKWPEALSTAKRAEGLLAAGGSEALRERVRDLRRDVEMVLRLEDARLQAASSKDGKPFDNDAMDAAHLQAFRDYGIDVETLPADRAAELMRASSIHLELTGALDYWASTTRSNTLRNKLPAIARTVQSDEWRTRVRDALWAGKRSQALLSDLAASDRVRALPPATLCALANALHQSSLTDHALALLRDAQRRHPDDFWTNFNLAFALNDWKQPPPVDEVVRFYSVALALRPRSTATLGNLGYIILFQKGQPDEAVWYLHKAIEIDPKHARSHSLLAFAAAKSGRLDDALPRFRRAADLDPTNALLLTNLGLALLDNGSTDEAIVWFHKAIAITEDSMAKDNSRIGLGLPSW